MCEYKLWGDTYQIKRDPTTRNKFYCVMQNPFNKTAHDTVVLWSTGIKAMKNKINRQYKEFKKEGK
jgi:hypothetical protein